MRVHDLPFAVHTPKQERLVTTIVYFALVPFDGRFHFSVGDGPREITFQVRFDIGKIQFEAIECVTLRFHVMPNQVIKTGILTTRFNVTGAFKIQKMFTKRRAIRLLPSCRYGINNGDQRRRIIFLCPRLL